MSVEERATFYSPGQLGNIYNAVHQYEPFKWFLLGGPANANEAQTALRRWPGVKVVGVEPNPDAIAFQLSHGWPGGHPLINRALWGSIRQIHVADTGSTLVHARAAFGGDLSRGIWQTTTWDELDKQYGPFEDALLWMDIEGSELEALQGALGLLNRKAILAANIELLSRPEEPESWGRIAEIDRVMHIHGYHIATEWNNSTWCRDRVYVLTEKPTR